MWACKKQRRINTAEFYRSSRVRSFLWPLYGLLIRGFLCESHSGFQPPVGDRTRKREWALG